MLPQSTKPSATHRRDNRRDMFTRSVSDSHAGQGTSIPHFTPLAGHPSVDDHDLELAHQKPSGLMSSSNSLPNLADFNSEPLPDISDWGELDLPFDIYENFALAENSQNTASREAPRKIDVGIADKTQFFRHESSASSRHGPGMPPLPLSPNNNQNNSFFKMENSNADVTMHGSSSASVDTRDTMRELAKQIAPVNKEGVEFAPLDDLHLNMTGSYSMSVDEALLQDPLLNQSLDKKFDLPESFSMSSWSQHTISADVFGPHHIPHSGQKEFSRDGLLLTRRAPSDQSITEKMLEGDEWDDDSPAPEGSDPSPGTKRGAARLTKQALRQHQREQANSSGGRGAPQGASARGTTQQAAAGRGSRPGVTRGAKLNNPAKNHVESTMDNSQGMLAIAIDRTATVPVEPSPQPPQPQYTFPSTYSNTLARSNSGPTSASVSSASSTSEVSQSTALSPVYDPATGIVYYPVMPGTALPAAAQGAMPAHLLPLPGTTGSGRSPTYPERLLPVSRVSDDGSLQPSMYEADAYAHRRSNSNTSIGKFEVGTAPPPGPDSTSPRSNTTTPKGTVKKERNRGSYRCGRCGKPKVNHVCAFVDTSTAVSQAVQASGPVINPADKQPFPGDRVLTVNPHRKSIQENRYENLGMVGNLSRSGSIRLVSRSNSTGVVTQDALARSGSGLGSSDPNSSGSAVAAVSGTLARSNSGSALFDSLSRSGDELVEPRSPGGGTGSNRPSVAFMQPLTQIPEQQEAQHDFSTENDDEVFFPTAYPPSAGLVFSGSRNSSVNSTYGNESDTSSTYGETHQKRSSITSMLNVDLGLSKFFRF